MQESLLLAKKKVTAVNTKLLMHLNGTLNDAAGHIGSTTAGVSYLSGQKFGNKAATFTSSGYVGYANNVPNASDFVLPGDFTIEMFLSLGILTQEQMAVSGGPGSYIDFYTGASYNGGQPGVLVSMQSTNSHIGMITVPHGWSINTIHHLALTRQGSTVSLWLDGVNKQQITNTNPWVNGGGSFVLGNYNASPAYGWTGGIQEFRMSGICRYPGTTTFTPPTGPFVLD
jgi:hypothetical protein